MLLHVAIAAEVKHLSYPSMLFSSHKQDAGLKVGQPGLEPALLWDASITGSSCTCYATMLASTYILIISVILYPLVQVHICVCYHSSSVKTLFLNITSARGLFETIFSAILSIKNSLPLKVIFLLSQNSKWTVFL